jgi:diguanylate cyclase (GGDEF)-like protein
MKSASFWTCTVSLTLWLALCFGAATIVVERNIRDVEADLTQYGDAYSDHLDKLMVSSETILKGFSALFGAIGRTDPAKASSYVKAVIESNPQIFSLEIVQSVGKNQLETFVARMRRDGIPNFAVKSFSYDSDRKWEGLKEKDFYYPIVFMEPMQLGFEDVLGLDVESVPFLRSAMMESLQRRTPVASHPFRLVEGNLAYVVFCPIAQTSHAEDSAFASTARDEQVVDMVIDANILTRPVNSQLLSGTTVRVYHKDFRPDDPQGQLLEMSGETRSSIELALFPSFVYQKPLATMGEPFLLMVKRQVGWSDLNLGLLLLMALLTLISSLMLLAYMKVRQRSRILQIENQNRLWHLANHDALTGLPNRMLLMDRLGQLLARKKRQGSRMAIMFLDLNDFKKINDSYGHEVGDCFLTLVADRLSSLIREEDTVARLSGDEFVIVFESVENQEILETVNQKIQQQLSAGFQVKGKLIAGGASIGIAMFPEDGEDANSLINKADLRMYENKKVDAQ